LILRFLIDTHIVVRWLVAPKKLSREQARVLADAVRRREPVGVSAITLLEIAAIFGKGGSRRDADANQVLGVLESDPGFEIVPFTLDAAAEMAALGPPLRDPGDRAIVATARVCGLRLITSDQRIIDSNLVPVVA
jgi:PIN domain nuclease of toxin-antitoxin system